MIHYTSSDNTIERYSLLEYRYVRVVFDIALDYKVTPRHVIKAAKKSNIPTINHALSIVRPSHEKKIRSVLDADVSTTAGVHIARSWSNYTPDPDLILDTSIRDVGAYPAWFIYCKQIDPETGKIIEVLDDHIAFDPRLWNEIHGGPEWYAYNEAMQDHIRVVDRYSNQVFEVTIEEARKNLILPGEPDEYNQLYPDRPKTEYLAEKIIDDDILNGRICISGMYRSVVRPMFPYIVSKVIVTLRSTTFNECEWDPMGQIDGRVGVLQIGPPLKSLVEVGECLTVRQIDKCHYEIQ